jgi:MYXO-CTERM domain-containing protein
MRRRFSSWLGEGRANSLRRAAWAAGFLVAASACGGGGCNVGCGGGSVIPGGFPKDQRVQNSAAVRITRPGLDFLEQNLGKVVAQALAGEGSSVKDGVMTFTIPESKGSTKLLFITLNYTICAGGPKPDGVPPKCVVEIDLKNIKDVKFESRSPHELKVNLKVPIRMQRLPIEASVIGNVEASLGDGSCSALQFVEVPFEATIDLAAVPDDPKRAVRAGYTKISLPPDKFSFNRDAVGGAFKFCGSGFNDDIANFLKGLITGMILDSLGSQLVGPLTDATCMTPQKLADGTDQCPTGTFNRKDKCRFEDKDDGECVPTLLGLEQRLDLSGFLASLSPGTSGGLDIMLAAGGDMNPAPGTGAAQNGMTLGMLGGAIPQPVSACVPQAPNPLPTGIQLPEVFTANEIPDWKGTSPPHLGIGLAERYLNHAAAGAFNSGLFCIGISSEQVNQLNAGLFSLLLPSIKGLSDKFSPGDTAPAMALGLRPQQPPVVKLGDNLADFSSPLIDLRLKDTDIDFYMWSHERFVRLFTGRIDIAVPINLEAGKDGIGLKFAPKSPLSFTNPRISNNVLLLEKDEAVGKLVESIGGLIPASTFSAIQPFKVDDALASFGLKLTIPEGGVRKIEKGEDRFLGIFGYLEAATAAIPTTTTTARIAKLEVDPKNFVLETVGDAPPRVFVRAHAAEDDGSRRVEYAYRVDRGPWTSFFPERDFTVTSPFFVLQGKHTIYVTSRIAGVVESEGEPVALPVIIDVLPPSLKVKADGHEKVEILAGDLVSNAADLKVEAKVDDGTWAPVAATTRDGKTIRLISVPAEATSIEVRATDEAGNVATITQPLIRGRADPNVGNGGSGGCGCAVPGSAPTSHEGLLAFAGLAALAGVFERRRRRLREAASAGVFVIAAGASGCSCAGGEEEAPACNGKPDLRPVVIGSHTSAAVGKDGTIWVAGYNEGDSSGGTADDFQADLVVGKLDPATGTVAWATVDGVPAPADPGALERNNCGFRNGVLDPGDDVGQYTAMIVDGEGRPIVAYFDRTNGALKVARSTDSGWAIHTVDQKENGWAGKFNAMTIANGKVVVAYQSIELGTGGFARAKVRVASATVDAPSRAEDWSIEDATVEEQTPCVPEVCGSGQKCLAGGSGFQPICAPAATGCDRCGDGETCAKKADGQSGCAKVRPVLGQYVNAIGTGIGLAAGPSGDLGLVFYDRVNGNVRAATRRGGAWSVTPKTAPLDGWTSDVTKNKETGDRGIGATLAIAPNGDWHVAYADGIKESLHYKFVPGGDLAKAAPTVTVDDGASADGTPATAFKDGQHVVGENAQIVVDGADVKIVYQDATSGTLRWAKGAGGAAAKFTRGVVRQDGFAGFWPRLVGGKVVNFYRARGTTTLSDGTEGDPAILGDVRALDAP